ncbi:hypothetical protein AVEN_68319-1 [Araneus ventricosus]|uniref:Uncharacterized protein n=1 Tax=Araneus ventricosus TaxID=182803 RepID=A0A4Y2P3X3_ARAVE|nr:hypothetical protein AVEN_68319-1 [Araneus ventricosus]
MSRTGTRELLKRFQDGAKHFQRGVENDDIRNIDKHKSIQDLHSAVRENRRIAIFDFGMKRQNSFDVSNPVGSRRICLDRWESGRIEIGAGLQSLHRTCCLTRQNSLNKIPSTKTIQSNFQFQKFLWERKPTGIRWKRKSTRNEMWDFNIIRLGHYLLWLYL